MKFLGLRRFTGRTFDDVGRWLGADLQKGFTDVVVGLRKLTFSDNFASFVFKFTASAGSTVRIPNVLLTPDVYWFPVRLVGGSGLLEDANDPFTKDFVPINNPTAGPITATVLFVRA